VRHIFYGLSLLDKLPAHRLARIYLIWAMTDENYSVITTLPAATTSRQMLRVAMLNHGWWILGSLFGAAVGSQFTHSMAGIDFSLAALFAVLAVEQWRASTRVAPIVTAVIAYGVASAVAPSHALLVAIGLSLLAGMAMSRRSSTKGAP